MARPLLLSLALLLTALSSLQAASALRLRAANIPVYRQIGDSATLLCDYDLEGQSLYAVKWYKDNVEFYRYMPRSLPPKLDYSDISGIHVDLPQSDEISVRLKMLDMSSTGHYRCEVSAEAPNFDTVNSAGTMVVIVLPENDPVISGQEDVYGPGSWINLTCTSERSKPAAQLMWFVNQKRVSYECLVPYNIVVHPDGLETSMLGLQILIDTRSFRSGAFQMTCVAYINAINYASKTTDVIANYARPQSGERLVQQRQTSFIVRGAGVMSAGPACWLLALSLLLLRLTARESTP